MKHSRKQKLGSNCLTLLLCAIASIAFAEQETTQQKDLRLLLGLLSGEFNNYNQVNSQDSSFLDKRPSTDYSRLHQKRQPIYSNNIEGRWLYAQINRLDRDGKIYRQSYLHFFIDDLGKIRSRAYKLSQQNTEKKSYPSESLLSTLSREQLEPRLPMGCDTTWQRQLNQFVGSTDPNTCVIDSKYKNEKRRIFSEDIVGEQGFWAHEGAYDLGGKLVFGLEAPHYYRYQRARPMTCWAAVHLGNDDWEFHRNLQTHDAGGSVNFGTRREYRLQLKRTELAVGEWSNLLEIFIYRKDEEKALAYSSTEPAAKHVTINLREVQASCKLTTQ